MPIRRDPELSPTRRAHLHELVNQLPQSTSTTWQKPKEYIYVTKAEFGFKIGMTSRPKSRPLQVAGNCPIKLEVVLVMEVDDMRKAEARLHRFFENKRLRGEWFALTAEDIALIRGFPASFDELPDAGGEDVAF